MAQNVSMNASNTINGSYGELYLEGQFMSQTKEVKAKLTFDKEEVKRSSSRMAGYKLKGIKGDGTLNLHKVDSKFLAILAKVASDPRAKMPVFSRMVVQLDDPESLGVERVALKNVKFWEIEFGFTLDSILEQSLPFTFEGIEMEKEIVGDPTSGR